MIFHQSYNSLTNYRYNICTYHDRAWEPHFHKNLELIYVLEGQVNSIVNGTTYSLQKGEFGLCLPYDIHAHYPQKNTTYWVMVFSSDYVHLFAKNISGKSAAGFSFRCPKEVEAVIQENLMQDASPSIYLLKACLYAVCDAFSKTVPLIDSPKAKEAISKISEYVAENHTENLTLSHIATLLGYDYHYVSRYWHSIFQIPFSEFLNTYRLETAIHLMETTNAPIATIALESGFQSVRTFNYTFKKAFGVSPSVYKKSVSASVINASNL